jgi:hypothetical protein
MDDIERHRMEQRQKDYRELYKNDFSGVGIFVKKKRKQLLGIVAKSGGKAGHGKGGFDRKTLSNFWYDVRESVKTALIDLQLFLETANDKDVDAVITREALSGVLSVLLSPSRGNGERAKVAQLLAEQSLEYLRHKSKYVTKSQSQIFEDAIEASKQLTLLLLPEKERGNFFWTGESRW